MRTLPVLLVLACQVEDPPDGTEPTRSTPPSTSTRSEPTSPCVAPRLVINELVASNLHGIVDQDGDSSDWLELFNASAAPVSLEGWWLSDSPGTPRKWPLPGVTLAPGEFLLLFASGKDIGRGVGVQTWDTKVDQGHTWRYREITGPVEAGWQVPDYDDSAWATGPSGFGRGDGDDATPISAPRAQIRTTMAVSADELKDLVAVRLHVDYDDGFIAWINGVQVASENLGTWGSEPPWDAFANAPHEADLYQGGLPARYEVDLDLIGPVNTLALTVADFTATSSDLTLIPFLSLGYRAPRAGVTSAALDPDAGELHTNFKLSADGERVLLLDPDGCPADQVNPGKQWADYSYGRTTDGGTALGYFQEPTPGAPNLTESRPGFADAPSFSLAPGFYAGGVDVSVAAGPSARLVVAADGVEPHEVDPPYAGPIALDGSEDAEVLRARAFQDGRWPSSIATATYFGRGPGPLAVISLVTDPPNLWDWDTGIHVRGDGASAEPPHRGANFWEDWERPLHVSMWEPDGSAAFAVDAGVEIFGGNSRGRPQKSLKLKLRAGYGDPVIPYEVFPGLGIAEFDDLVLRNSGSDWLGCSEFRCYFGSFFRDALMHRITEGADMDRLAYRPAVVYLNGEFWGLMNIRERAHASYVAAHHGVEDIDLLGPGGRVMVGDGIHYGAMLQYLRDHDLSDPAVYATVETMMDVEQYANYQIFEIWFDNKDFPGNNVKHWRPRTKDGRWRWLLYDLDFGMGLWGAPVEDDALALALAPDGTGWPNPPEATELFRLMMSAPAFRTMFVNRYADLMNTSLVPSRTQALLAEMAAELAPVIPSHIARWGAWIDGTTTTFQLPPGAWQDTVSRKHDWLGQRSVWATGHVLDNLGLAGTWTLQLDADPPGSGAFELTAVTVDAPFTGAYFQGVPVTVTAVPAAGYHFVQWAEPGLPDTASVTLDPAASMQLTAVFDK